MHQVIVGGGIAGTCCARMLAKLCPNDTITLVAATDTVHHVVGLDHVTSRIMDVQVANESAYDVATLGGYAFVQGTISGLDVSSKELKLADGTCIKYDSLCICTGARPRQLPNGAHEHVHVLRDHDSIKNLAAAVHAAKSVMVVGNGGIALELVSALTDKHVIWSMKHGHAGDAFFDLDAASYLLTRMQELRTPINPFATAARDTTATGDTQGGKAADGGGGFSGGGFSGVGAMGVGATGVSSILTGMGEHGCDGSGQSSSTTHSGNSFRMDSVSSADAHSPSLVMCQGRRHGYFGHAVGPQWTQQLLPEGGAPFQTHTRDPSHGREEMSTGDSAAGGRAEAGASEAVQGGAQQAGSGGAGVGETRDVLLWEARGSAPRSWELELEYGTMVMHVEPVTPGTKAPLRVTLDNGHAHIVDMVVAAIGVQANIEWLPPDVQRGDDGGVLVDKYMQSNVPGVFAAGDCVTVAFDEQCPHWFQMRLWGQARTMGLYAAHCMAGRANHLMCGFNFELFTHVTRFAGQKVVLLGLYNGQKLDNEPNSDIVTYARATEGPGGSFVRVLLLRGRMQGAVLIGETGLEEVFENLILTGLDLSPWGPGLLDPHVDLADMFD